ncbi:MAG: 4Fe-4S dicluster domain-containing protein [Acidobacteria bacterium]|nr:4Fe-4S dicluster domain-containing protein [Acidobacteriota bacterium]
MVELYTVAFPRLLKRMFQEYEKEGKIFDLPKSKFYYPDSKLDFSVSLHDLMAGTPVGPAAGPQSQLAQNIVLSWLAGSRIIELKTVQINDELKIPRPCIDATNVGYNVEWSQELKLPVSLQEYVAGSMLIEILRRANIIDGTSGAAGETIYDMSVGYDLAGIKSEQVCAWMEQMRNASKIIEQLREQIPAEFSEFRDIDFNSQISNSITLSTFHGCPANEIEKIVEFLLDELNVHTIIKMNPTLLGKEAVEHLLHDVMGYQEISVTQEAFDKDLQFDQALEICDRLGKIAARKGKKLGAKFSNTLVVRNHRSFFSDKEMYLSGAPLHIITSNLVKKFRAEVGPDFPISFSAGIEQHNFPDAVAQGFVPVTTCTDLLRPGGYGRLPAYLKRLGQQMQTLGVDNIGDYVIKAENHGLKAIETEVLNLSEKLGDSWQQFSSEQQDLINNWTKNLFKLAENKLTETSVNGSLKQLFAEEVSAFTTKLESSQPTMVSSLLPLMSGLYQSIVSRAAWLNTQTIVPRLTTDIRYTKQKNSAIPKKIGSQLWLYDCINCDKCIPVCPNDANFVYELKPLETQGTLYQIDREIISSTTSRTLKITKTHQIGNFADFCNECGNCDVFCPEDGGPYIEKPRFFGSLETMRLHSKHDGCYFERDEKEDKVYGRFAGQDYLLTVARAENKANFTNGKLALVFDKETGNCEKVEKLADAQTGDRLDTYYYYVLSSLLDAVMNSGKINYLNIQ